MQRMRLDSALVKKGLAPSREAARQLIEAGLVRVSGRSDLKPSSLIDPLENVVVEEGDEFFSRGASKLKAALSSFPVAVSGKVWIDLGSSTGGFTKVLLEHGALRVHAVDVGKNLLHPRLARDPRVVLHEGINARYLTYEMIGEPCGGATVDLSFISVCLVLPALRQVLEVGADVVVLVKPQFEVGHKEASRFKGVIKDSDLQLKAVEKVGQAMKEMGAEPRGSLPVQRSSRKNLEVFLWGVLGHVGDLEATISDLKLRMESR